MGSNELGFGVQDAEEGSQKNPPGSTRLTPPPHTTKDFRNTCSCEGCWKSLVGNVRHFQATSTTFNGQTDQSRSKECFFGVRGTDERSNHLQGLETTPGSAPTPSKARSNMCGRVNLPPRLCLSRGKKIEVFVLSLCDTRAR